jgi:hypothetical protein
MEEDKKIIYFIHIVRQVEQTGDEYVNEVFEENPNYKKLQMMFLLVKSKLRH